MEVMKIARIQNRSSQGSGAPGQKENSFHFLVLEFMSYLTPIFQLSHPQVCSDNLEKMENMSLTSSAGKKRAGGS
jgi:hypothetical protein